MSVPAPTTDRFLAASATSRTDMCPSSRPRAFALHALGTALWALAACTAPDARGREARPSLHLNQIQAKGTHNSYHLIPRPLLHRAWDYDHLPLERQLEEAGVRQVELDVHFRRGVGFEVFHVPIVDARSSCGRLRDCLRRLERWSREHPDHHALFVFLEPKDDFDLHSLRGRYEAIEREILAVWSRERILAPDDVRKGRPTLRQAILQDGWPTVEETRGKVVFVLLDRGAHREAYSRGHPSLAGRLMFVTSSEDRPDAAILSIDDPIRHFDRIRAAVRRGFLVRTRADAEGREPLRNDRRRQRAALESGAQIVSTDFPVPVPGRPYWFTIPGGTPSRPNPVTAPPGARAADVERLPAK